MKRQFEKIEGALCLKGKITSLSIILIFLSSVTHAQESEGLLQKAYKKYILKEKIVEKKPASKPRTTSTDRETTGEDARTTVYDGAYKDMPKSEMIQEIRDEVDSEEEILEQIPQLKRQKDKDGKDAYSYLVEGKQVNLEDLDEKILRTLIEQVSAKAGQIRFNAIQEQQEQLRTIRSARPPQPPSQPPRAPERPPVLPRR